MSSRVQPVGSSTPERKSGWAPDRSRWWILSQTPDCPGQLLSQHHSFQTLWEKNETKIKAKGQQQCIITSLITKYVYWISVVWTLRLDLVIKVQTRGRPIIEIMETDNRYFEPIYIYIYILYIIYIYIYIYICRLWNWKLMSKLIMTRALTKTFFKWFYRQIGFENDRYG